MKLIEGKNYLYKEYSLIVTYAGKEEDFTFRCDNCKKEVKNTHFFVVGDIEDPSSSYTFGSECVKKCIVKL